MNANYIYDIFETTRKNEAHDLTIGLAMLRAEKPIPEGMTDDGIREFLGRHYEDLVDAFKAGDQEAFAEAVAACEAKDAEKAAQEAREG